MTAHRMGFGLAKRITALLAVGVFAFGCVTTGGGQPLTAEEQRLRDQADDFNETVVQGAVVGAIAGAVLGALLGGNNRAQGALVGAAAGGAIGGAGGYYVAKQKEAYGNEQARLDSMTRDVRADNTRLASYISNTQKVVAKNRDELQVMRAAVAQGTREESDMRALVVKVEGNRDAVGKALEGLKENRDEYLNASAQMTSRTAANTAPMDSEIQRLNGQIQALEREHQALNRLVTVNTLS